MDRAIDHDLVFRFWSKVDVQSADGCWLWTASMFPTGYGSFFMWGKTRTAHRAVYIMIYGEPGALHVDHLCRTRACVNPLHLEAVTPQENTRRGLLGVLSPYRESCSRGHQWTTSNTRIRPCGRRECIICKRSRERNRVFPPGHWKEQWRRRSGKPLSGFD